MCRENFEILYKAIEWSDITQLYRQFGDNYICDYGRMVCNLFIIVVSKLIFQHNMYYIIDI